MPKPTDTTERGLEDVIADALTGRSTDAAPTGPAGRPAIGETPARYDASAGAGAGYALASPADFDAAHGLDPVQLVAFLEATQPDELERANAAQLGLGRGKLLDRIQGEITKRGVVDVLLKGVRHLGASLDLFYGTPTPGNATAAVRFDQNRFTVTRQLHYSPVATGRSLDLVVMINGLPVVTYELKNRLTNQTHADAIAQYRTDRDPKELLFQPGRCAVHFALDDTQVWFCAELSGRDSRFLPFNRGFDDGAGNPPNPAGIATDYLWRETLTRRGLANILEHYARADPPRKGGGRTMSVLWPRYHQLDVVRRLLADAARRGAGRRYLVQHSAGSGKSNSIAWLAHQLVSVRPEGALPGDGTVFDTVIIVTDRRVLDDQIEATVKRAGRVKGFVAAAETSGQLREHLLAGARIITTTLQKFPMVVDAIDAGLADRRFAIVIDEAHSSQGGRAAAAMNQALGTDGPEGPDGDDGTGPDEEDRINAILAERIEGRRLLGNASYFAFTATPKARTLELFGEPVPAGADGSAGGAARPRRPIHSYTMKQAIGEGFIMDVLRNYTPVASWYRLAAAVEADPEFDANRARSALRHFVEGHGHAIDRKARIMVDHFLGSVVAPRKVRGEARAIVCCNGIDRAIDYHREITAALIERGSPYRAILAFSGEREVDGAPRTEAWFNGFASSLIPERLKTDPYRFLVVADKFLTGFDEPLLHTMYVDKTLSGIRAVQALSRLNRAAPGKADTFVLDFANDPEVIRQAFLPYYRTTSLADETDPNKLHDLVAALDGAGVYDDAEVVELTRRYLSGEARERLDPILDGCVAAYAGLDEQAQVRFKGGARAFVRTYNFLGAVLPYGSEAWERREIFLRYLVPKLPEPVGPEPIDGILDTVDMESYRIEKQATMALALDDAPGEVAPPPVGEGGAPPETLHERLSAILEQFNALYGGIEWTDRDRIVSILSAEMPERLLLDERIRNAINQNDQQNLEVELFPAIQRLILGEFNNHNELFVAYMNNGDFQRFLNQQMLAALRSGPRQPGLLPG